jgi:membrane-bound ClpP family serine protease
MKIRSEIITMVAELGRQKDKAGYILNNISRTKENTQAIEALEVVMADLEMVAGDLTEMLTAYDYPDTPINDKDIQ